MFGMEKNEKPAFEFDLEKDLKNDPKKMKVLIEQVNTRTEELKKMLREGTASEDFEQCGVLLHGYAALQKVIKKVTKQK